MHKKIKNKITRNLDKIYQTSCNVSKSFGLSTISLKVLRDVINLGKITKSDTNKDLHDFIEKHNEMLDILYTTCEDYTKQVKSDHLSKEFLKTCINKLKDNL